MLDELDYGEPIPGVSCPECGGELVHTHSGAFCDWCSALVPVIGTVVHLDDEDDEDGDQDDEDEE